jgi:hypothetical protein
VNFKVGDRVVITDTIVGISRHLGKLATVESLAISGTDMYFVYVYNEGYIHAKVREATEMDLALEGL